MIYARTKNGSIIEYPVYEGEIKLRYPNTSFPVPFIAPTEYAKVIDTPRPIVDYTKNVIEGPPVKNNDTWKRSWTIVAASAEEIVERTDAQALNVRIDRNHRLAACDWTQLPDAPVDAMVWAVYRQDLRDVTEQPGFPWNITWPEKP